MPRFERTHDPDRPGELFLQEGEPVALVLWTHDYAEREQTGWFLVTLDSEGEPDGEPSRRLAVSADVDRLAAANLPRAEWIAQAETVELVTAAAAVDVGESALSRLLGGHP